MISGDCEVRDEIRSILSDRGLCLLSHQKEAFSLISKGHNVIISAPTGMGKTEAAILPILNMMLKDKPPPTALLYITPLKALINDIRNRLDSLFSPYGFRVMRKHGDVSAKEKKERIKIGAHVLVTTPESLEIDMDMSPAMRRHLSNLKWVVVDEIHELVGNKRGLQLGILLERLRRLAGDFQVIALSATLANPLDVLEDLTGSSSRKSMAITSSGKKYVISVIESNDLKSVLNKIMNDEDKFLLFVNSRRLAEEIQWLLEELGIDGVKVHHSSVSRELRENVEIKLKLGEIKGTVATKTLELGIDVGSVDKVIHIGPPSSVISLVQRVGRSGHRIGAPAKGFIIALDEQDTILSDAAAKLAMSGLIEPLPRTPCYMDVVAREFIGYLMQRGGSTLEEYYDIVSSVKPCKDLTIDELGEVAKILTKGKIVSKKDDLYRVSRGFYRVWSSEGIGRDIRKFFSFIVDSDDKFTVLYGNKDVGTLDATFVMKYLRPWDRIRLGGKVWDIVAVDAMHRVVKVRPSTERGALPSWRGNVILYSGLIVSKIYEDLRKACDEKEETIQQLKEACEWYRRNKVQPPLDNELVVEKNNDEYYIYGPYSHRFFELLGYVLIYAALKKGKSNEAFTRTSPLGLAVYNLPLLLKALRENGDSIERVIKEAVKITPLFQMKLHELLPTFGIYKNEYVINEAIRQVLHELDNGENVVSHVIDFLKGRINIRVVEGAGLSPIARLISKSARIRPWYGGTSFIIAEALKGLALSVDEIAEVTGLPKRYIERKLKVMRKSRSSLRLIAFYDVFDGQIRWALAKELEQISQDLFSDSFNPSPYGTYLVTIVRERGDSGETFIVSPTEESVNRLINRLGEFDELYCVKVSYGDGRNGSIKYYNVLKKHLKLVIMNAITYLQRVWQCS